MRPREIRWSRYGLAIASMVMLGACARVRVEPVEVKPIHLTLDINIRVEEELADAFAFEEQILESVEPDAEPVDDSTASDTESDSDS